MISLRRQGFRRRVLVLATLAFGIGAVVAPSGAMAGPAVSATTPMTYGGANSCTGESFTGSGTLHFLTTENLSASGAIQFHLSARFDGLQAVTPTGKKYVVQDSFNWEFTIRGPGAEETFDITAHFVRLGEDSTFVLGDDFYEYFRTHITANANGIVTAFSVNTNDMPCQ
jgi:hypothetical protein